MNKNDLEGYSNAWSCQDIDKIMSYMTRDCIFETDDASTRNTDGCDLFKFKDGKIHIKISLPKNRENSW